MNSAAAVSVNTAVYVASARAVTVVLADSETILPLRAQPTNSAPSTGAAVRATLEFLRTLTVAPFVASSPLIAVVPRSVASTVMFTPSSAGTMSRFSLAPQR